jgi:hypothetical protein
LKSASSLQVARSKVGRDSPYPVARAASESA